MQNSGSNGLIQTDTILAIRHAFKAMVMSSTSLGRPREDWTYFGLVLTQNKDPLCIPQEMLGHICSKYLHGCIYCLPPIIVLIHLSQCWEPFPCALLFGSSVGLKSQTHIHLDNRKSSHQRKYKGNRNSTNVIKLNDFLSSSNTLES